jgi:histidinol phosphatase-like PHP family hydrolase
MAGSICRIRPSAGSISLSVRCTALRALARQANRAAAAGDGQPALGGISTSDRKADRRTRGCDVDLERFLSGAGERGCAIQVNGQPDRLDLDEVHCKLAKEIGVKLVLSTDAHNPSELGFMRYAVEQARRGWLEASDILNTRSLEGLRAALRRV